MKRLIVLSLLLLMTTASAYAQTIKDVEHELVNINGIEYLNISGKSYAEDEAVTISIVKVDDKDVVMDGNDPGLNPNDYIVYMGDTMKNADSFIFEIPLDSSMNGEALYIRIGNKEDIYTMQLVTVSHEKGKELAGYINTKNADELEVILDENINLYKNLGYKMDIYSLCGAEKETVCEMLAEGDRPYEDAVLAFNLAVFTVSANMASDADKLSEVVDGFISELKLNLSGNEKYKYICEKSGLPQLNSAVFEKKPYIDAVDFGNKYFAAIESTFNKLEDEAVLKEINDANYDTILGVLEKHKFFVGVDVSSAAKSMTSGNKDKFIRALCDLIFSDKNQAGKDIKSLIDKYGKTSSRPGSSGGSSGGGGYAPKKNNAQAPAVSVNTINQQVTEESAPLKKFNDMEGAKWAEEAVMALYNRGIISGVDENSFAPGMEATREQAIKMIVTAFDIKAKEEVEMSFGDVLEDAWYYEFVKAAYTNGIINGINETDFGTEKSITRQDLVTVLYRMIEKNVEKDDLSWAELSFGDASEIAPYALEAVSYFSSTGVINGIEENGNLLFKPGKSVTRAELAKIIYGVDGK